LSPSRSMAQLPRTYRSPISEQYRTCTCCRGGRRFIVEWVGSVGSVVPPRGTG
jgi:hypothetical protein